MEYQIMAKTKTTTEKRISVEEQIRQLEKERKQLIQKEKAEERTAKIERLCKRGELETSMPTAFIKFLQILNLRN